ncbi:hypothetical protein FRC12_007747 [Ceratobasidium sp. 428]|nr:hypothetical protein FRC12_007747 [Ceratobasidium sp. 428]
MLRASPDLEELGFDFEADRGSVSPDDRRNPSNIFTALADHIFPRLRVFAVTHLWLYEESPGLRRFLFHHPNLLSVDLCLNMDAEDSFDTEDIETVFPSVLKFRGPYKICRALTCSPVAQQLESFTIYKTYHLRHVRLPELPHPYGRSSPLPRLRNLEVIHSPVQIHDLVEMTPNVEKIRLSITSAVYFENTVPSKDFLKLLHQTPNLRVIELYRSYSGRMKKKLTADSVRWFIRQVATICPKLFRIDDLERDSIGYWDITHNHDGNVSFHYHFDPRFDLFPGLEFPRTPITSGLGSHPWNRHDEWYGSLGSVNGVV